MADPIIFESLTLDAADHLAKTRGTIIIPAATTEAHGDHLPLGTDTYTAEWIAEELSRRTGLPVLSPTPFRAGASPTFHYDLNGDPIPGTLAVSQQTLFAFAKDILRGLWATGFRKVIIVQGHGQEPHFQVIAHETATELRREGKNLFIAAATYWELAAETLRREVSTPFYHSGEEETSNVLFVRPDLVKLDKASGKTFKPLIDRSLLKRSITQDETETFQVFDIAQVIPIPQPGHLSRGGLGTTEDILTASAEKGRKVLERAVERYLDLIRDLEEHYGPQEVPGVDVRAYPEEKRFTVNY
ncbi:creatininase family protein [Pseudothauera nasutitermitis]|uniref:Creatininase family protein n=1 Tax=Pseudothauera nasutitermitis TaxID=2565930 RepID=A0A4S4B3H4_9RHOO|nr:creatininase family protein [Pseudothauera nasutitermitis]THF66290.1 creatininase family protein [Pseudothauera nasutitermitis]